MCITSFTNFYPKTKVRYWHCSVIIRGIFEIDCRLKLLNNKVFIPNSRPSSSTLTKRKGACLWNFASNLPKIRCSFFALPPAPSPCNWKKNNPLFLAPSPNRFGSHHAQQIFQEQCKPFFHLVKFEVLD